jgi:phosphoribosyl-AMP cyclohydrolase
MAEILVDDDNGMDQVEGSTLVTQLQEESTPTEQHTNKLDVQAADPTLPEKFRNKSVEDVVASYQNLEKQYGKQGNEMGELRKLADNLIQKNLHESNTQSSADALEEELSEDDFILNPVDAVKRVVEDALRPVKQELTRAQTDQTMQRVLSAHPDVESIVSSAQFEKWVMDSKPRQEMWLKANSGDFDYADEMLTQYKAVSSTVDVEQQATIQTAKEEELRAATAVSKGNSFEATATAGKPVYRRSELIRLQMSDPTRYAQLGNEITQAYAEGRVR